MNLATRAVLELQETTLLAARAARGYSNVRGTFRNDRPDGCHRSRLPDDRPLDRIFTGGVLTLQTFPTLQFYGAPIANPAAVAIPCP